MTVVIPVWNSSKWLAPCLEALAEQSFTGFSTIVVDDGSTDDPGGGLEPPLADCEIVRLPENRGFAVAANEGIRRALTPLVALLNVDTRAEPGWLAALVSRIEGCPPDVGGVASKLLRMDDPRRIEDAGNTLSRYLSAAKRGRDQPAEAFDEPGEIFSPCAAAALFRARFLHQAGLFDESFGSYFEDVELGLRGRLLGYRFVYEPAARVLHAGHGSGLPRARYVELMTRNRLVTALQALPASLLLRHAFALAWGQLYYLAAYRRPLASAAGYLRLIAGSRRILARRRELQRRRAVPVRTIDAALTRGLDEIPLRRLLARRLRRLAGAAAAGSGR